MKYSILLLALLVFSCGQRNANHHSMSEKILGTVKCEKLCKDGVVDKNKLSKYHTFNPYNLTQTTKGDSTKISFDVFADCGMDFGGESFLVEGTLLLTYHLSNTVMGSDCYCCYRMTYQVDKTNKTWGEIKIQNIDLD